MTSTMDNQIESNILGVYENYSAKNPSLKNSFEDYCSNKDLSLEGYCPPTYLTKDLSVESPTGVLNSQRFSYASTASSELSNRSSTEVNRESMAALRQIKEWEKKYNDTSNELERLKLETLESKELNRAHVRTIRQLEQDVSQLKIVNKSLFNDNKELQIRLSDKEGEYQKMEELYLEERRNNNERHLKSDSLTSTLSDDRETLVGERVQKESDHTLIEELQNKIKTLKDDNESMTLYIQKMLNRIMEVKGFEDTLATDWTSERSNKTTTLATKPIDVSSENQPKPSKNSRSNSLKNNFKFPQNGEIIQENSEPENLSSYSPSSPTIVEQSHEEDTTTVTRARKGSSSADSVIVRETITSARTFADPPKKEDPYMKPILLVQANEKK
ncbi:10227_t:CDS:2 [Diversispora eburnea]|uniref:10227_t:CDS:1 n=1 Tax=Diversispora eburnea TaxID=1213867 RepID=A0A9N8YQQ6_9GLOM|nr:10227_t:CDS:2 [Diversispora eburnea]